MKKFITENKTFVVTVIDHAKDGKREPMLTFIPVCAGLRYRYYYDNA